MKTSTSNLNNQIFALKSFNCLSLISFGINLQFLVICCFMLISKIIISFRDCHHDTQCEMCQLLCKLKTMRGGTESNSTEDPVTRSKTFTN